MAFAAETPEAARQWQADVRARLFGCMRMTDLVADAAVREVRVEESRTLELGGAALEELTFRSTPGRKIRVIAGKPAEGAPPWPAVICLHGHGGTRATPFDGEKPIYKQFGVELMKRGFVAIAPDVGQHEVYEPGRTLMGERLWDCMRCVDLAQSLPCVDPTRVSCAGLSLGGEMAMWLGAMDTRVVATASCGFLTLMDQMEQNHCLCWKFDGLRELVDFPDIYALIAPRPLQCQNGRREPPTQFTPELAEKALLEIKPAYAVLGAPDNVTLDIHGGAHEIDLKALLTFLDGK